MQTILFPTDFSENAKNAQIFALEVALRLKARVIFLNVSPQPYDFAARVAEVMEEMEKISKKNLKDIITSVKEDERFKSISCEKVYKTGNVASVITDTAGETHADLIIMGTKGASGLTKLLFGSNTAEVIRHSPVPVLAVPEQADFEQIDRLVYAVDYRDDDIVMLEQLAGIATNLNLKLSTLHIAPKDNLQEQILHRGLTGLVNEKFPGQFTSHELLIEKSLIKGMENYLTASPGAILALAHYKKPFIDSLLNKSVTNEMAYHVKSPLLIFNR